MSPWCKCITLNIAGVLHRLIEMDKHKSPSDNVTVVECFHGNRAKHWLFSGEDKEILQGSAISVSASWIDLLNGSVLDSSVQFVFIRGKKWLLTDTLLLMAFPSGPGMKSFTGPIQPLWYYKTMNNSPSIRWLGAAVLIHHTVPVYAVLFMLNLHNCYQDIFARPCQIFTDYFQEKAPCRLHWDERDVWRYSQPVGIHYYRIYWFPDSNLICFRDALLVTLYDPILFYWTGIVILG